MKKCMSIIMLLFAIAIISGVSAAAEPDAIAQLTSQVEALTKRVEALEAQLLALQTKPAPAPKAAPAGIPDDVDAKIKASAAAEYPDNNRMQVYAIKQQREAYQKLQAYTSDVPGEELQKFMEKAKQEYPDNYRMQIYSIDREVEAYKELH